MSTLGKILTVLVVLVAVGVAVSVTISVVLNDNWKAIYNAEHANFEEAKVERDIAIAQTKDEKAARGEERTGLSVRVNNLMADVARGVKDKEAIELNLRNQEARNQQLITEVGNANSALKTAQGNEATAVKARDAAMTDNNRLTKENSDLDGKLKVNVRNLAEATETIRTLSEDKKAEQSKLAWIMQNYPDVKLPSVSVPVPPEKIRGLVTRVDNEAKLVTINLGADDGVVAGMKFYVYNGSQVQYLATLVVTMVQKDSAAGELTVIRDAVKVNDHVTNRF